MSLWENIQADLEAATGISAKLEQHGTVGGGCINEASRIRYGDAIYFVKFNRASGFDMFAAEAQGLKELRQCNELKIPAPVCFGSDGQSAWLVMENLAPKKPHTVCCRKKGEISLKLAKDDKHMDLSHRQLSVVASETGEVEASASSFYRVMKQEQLMEKHQRKPKTTQAKPEVKPDGPNQVWSWGILPTSP